MYLFLSLLIKRLSTHDLDLAVHGGPRLDRTLVKLSVAWRMVTSESELDELSGYCALMEWTSRTRACS